MPPPDAQNKSSELSIERVDGKAALERFIRVPWRVFRDDPHWVPPLLLERRDHLNPKKNPYFEHAEVCQWIAYQDGEAVGRVSAQIDQNYLAHHNDQTGQFGFLDAVDDAAVFKGLTEAAEGWLRDKGIRRVVGPFSLSINDESGLLIDGFDSPPFFMTGHGFPYYGSRLDELGYQKAQDLISYGYDPYKPLDPRIQKLLNRLHRNPALEVRTLDWSRYDDDIRIVLDIFNDAWSDNWGFVPFTERELRQVAKDLKPLLRKELVIIAELDGQPVAMAVAFPNLNEAIADLNGRLLPFGWFKVLWRLKVKKLKSARLALMGVNKAHRNTTLGASLGFAVIEQIRENSAAIGITDGELGWVLENNPQMWRMIEAVGGWRRKIYRVYEKDLG